MKKTLLALALLALLAIGLVSTGFAGAMLGRLVLGRMGRYLAAAIMGVLVGLVSALPYAAVPMRAIAYLLTLGYVVRSLRLGMRQRKEARDMEVVQF